MNPASTVKRFTHRFGVWRYSAIELLAALLLLIVVMPFLESSPSGEFIEAALLTLVLVTAGLAVGGRRKTLYAAMLLLLPTIIAKWTQHLFPQLLSPVLPLVLSMIFTGFVAANILRFILRAALVNAEVICAAISVFILTGLLWTFAYVLVGQLTPDAFVIHTDPHDPQAMTSFNAFYFSICTLSTVGFGDITPISKVARTLAFLEAMAGVFYVAILISRLVSMYKSKSDARE
jgi:hypothetical protein